MGVLAKEERKSEIRTIAWTGTAVRMIDQTVLPARLEDIEYTDWRLVVEAIRTMVVRGAPAIGCAAAFGMALAAQQSNAVDASGFERNLEIAANALRGSRPTAVNLFWAVDRMLGVATRAEFDPQAASSAMHDEAIRM